MSWLFEAKKRFKLHILNYMATSNHIHLLMLEGGKKGAIPKAMQLIAGRTAQEFNRGKGRRGAFWDDRHHATAVETDHHLIRCLTYIDLNMVRAGAVAHPSQWPSCGYAEIQKPRERYSIIDHEVLMDLLGIPSVDALHQGHAAWVEEVLARSELVREGKWTESIAVGSRDFVETIEGKLRVRAKGCRISGTDGEVTLREPQASLK